MDLKGLSWLEILKKIRDFITIEPLVICWLLPAVILQVAQENLELEKSCRVNLDMGKEVCDLMIRKPDDLDCSVFAAVTEAPVLAYNDTLLGASMSNMTMQVAEVVENVQAGLFKSVCFAEEESQKLLATIKGIRSPISSIFPLIIVLFAGGYSDKYNIRKPLMILPMIGDMLAVVVLLIASIFMYQLPMEFSGYLEKIFPALTGNFTLMIMGIFSYLTAISKEEDRTFRFGLFSVMVSVIPTLSFLAGPLYNALGYVQIFLLALIIYAIGLLYGFFYLKEIKVPVTTEQQDANGTETVADTNGNKETKGMDNMGFQDANGAEVENRAPIQTPAPVAEGGGVEGQNKKNFCREFFDPTLALACIQVVRKKRENLKHVLIWFLIGSYIIIVGTTLGEQDYLYQFTRLQLNWNGVDLSYYITYSTVLSLIGTMLMVSVLSKIFKISDPMIGVLASTFSIVSRPIVAFSRTTLAYYVGSSFDLFIGTRILALRSISSTCVHPDEISRLYAVFGVMEPICGFIFPPIYSAVYVGTLKTFPGTIYFLSTGFLVITTICFMYVYIQNKRHGVSQEPENADQETPAQTVVETAHL